MHETDAPAMCGEGLVPWRNLWWLLLAFPPMLLVLSGAASWAEREVPSLAVPLTMAAAHVPDLSAWAPVREARAWWRGGL